jgi:uncharacterized membrane protein
MLYLILKSLHVVSVVLFLGNIITGVFWKVQGDLRGDLKSKEQALDGIIKSDRIFTTPNVFLIVITGIATALLGGIPILSTPWILWSIILFGVSGAAFAIVAPTQKKLLANVRTGLAGEWDRGAYERLSRTWTIWGTVATGAPLAAVFLMVLKPA